MTKETMSKTPPTVPDLPSCLTSDGKWVVLDSDEASDPRFKKVAPQGWRLAITWFIWVGQPLGVASWKCP